MFEIIVSNDKIDSISEQWHVKKLSHYIEKLSAKNKKGEQYPVYSVSNKQGIVLSDDYFDKRVYSKQLHAYKILEKNCFAYNPYRINVGSLGLFTHDVGLVSPAYVIFRVSDANQLDPEFLLLYLQTEYCKQEIFKYSASRGSVRHCLSFEDLADFTVAVPPIEEQRKIANVLSIIQESREKTEKVIGALKELKKSMMKHLFTYGPVPVSEIDKVELKVTEYGEKNCAWEELELEKCVENIEYGHSISIPDNKDNNGISIISTADINKQGDILYNQIRKIMPLKRTPERLLVTDGDVLFNWRNSPELIGKSAVFKSDQAIEKEYIYASFILRIRCNELLTNNFWLMYLLNNYREIGVFVKLARRAVNQANYNRNEINVLKICRPDIETQHIIVEMLSNLDEKIRIEMKNLNSIDRLFKSMLDNLITAKIRL